jgi:hypothetical protein
MISIQRPVYSDITKPNVNRMLVNLIYFDFIDFRKCLDEPKIKYTQDETTDEIEGLIRDRMIGHHQHSQVRFSEICFSFFRNRNPNQK